MSLVVRKTYEQASKLKKQYSSRRGRNRQIHFKIILGEWCDFVSATKKKWRSKWDIRIHTSGTQRSPHRLLTRLSKVKIFKSANRNTQIFVEKLLLIELTTSWRWWKLASVSSWCNNFHLLHFFLTTSTRRMRTVIIAPRLLGEVGQRALCGSCIKQIKYSFAKVRVWVRWNRWHIQRSRRSALIASIWSTTWRAWSSIVFNFFSWIKQSSAIDNLCIHVWHHQAVLMSSFIHQNKSCRLQVAFVRLCHSKFGCAFLLFLFSHSWRIKLDVSHMTKQHKSSSCYINISTI